MLVRLGFGILKGLLVGGAVFALVVYGLSLGAGAAWTYIGAGLVGILTALVAGRPVWAGEAKIEAGLKSLVGLVVALVAVFVVRKWLAIPVDLSVLGQGSAALGDQPLLVFPAIGGGLGILFEVDNAVGSESAARQRVAAAPARIDLSDADAAASDENAPPASRRVGKT